jgi:hypothetical protein
VSAYVTFPALDISQFDNANFKSSWEATYKSQLATSAGVSSSDVIVNGIAAGRCACQHTAYIPPAT